MKFSTHLQCDQRLYARMLLVFVHTHTHTKKKTQNLRCSYQMELFLLPLALERLNHLSHTS